MKPSIAFVCIGNACRSQISEGLANQIAQGKWEIFSAGSRPAGFVAPQAIEVLAELGIDGSKQFSKGVDQLPQKEFDWVITMGCGDQCPNIKAKNRRDWNIPDPIGRPLEFFRQVREDLRARIQEILEP